MARQEASFTLGQLVWAKMKGFPYWPGKVMDENEVPDMRKPKVSGKRKTVCVKFFGGGSEVLYAFIATNDVRPYFLFQDKYSKTSKKKDFVAAVQEAENYARLHPEVRNLESADGKGNAVEPDASQFDTKGNNSVADDIAPLSDNVSLAESSSEVPLALPQRPNDGLPEKSHLGSSRVTKRVATRSNGPNGGGAVAPKRFASSPSFSSPLQLSPSPSQPSIRVENNFKNKKVGFIGLGMIGSRLVRRLIGHGFNVTIYDRSFNEKVSKDLKDLAQVATAANPAALMQECDIVFDCVYDSDAVREVYFGTNGVGNAITPGKAYVELTTIDPQTAIELFEAVSASGGRFLEAPLSGLKKDAEEGGLVFLCAGDKSLFDECDACFQALGRRAVFFGDAGSGAKFRLLHQMLAGVIISGVAEVAAAAFKCNLSIIDLIDIMGKNSPMGCALVQQSLKDIMHGTFEPRQQLGQLQRELQSALTFTGYDLAQPAFVSSAANQAFLYARRWGEEMSDSAAVYRTLSEPVHQAETDPALMQPEEGEGE